jgi:hypothetical protein
MISKLRASRFQRKGSALCPSMLILFGHGTVKGLARALTGHITIITTHARGWDKGNKARC